MDESLEPLLRELAAGAEPPAEAVASPRERITRAALEVFAERAYEGATTRAIAERAGVTERTLFKHFPSKEQLFARTVFPALLRVLQPLAVAPLREVLAHDHGDLRATLRALVAERLAFARRHPALVAMLARELLVRPAFREAFLAFFEAQVWPGVRAIFEAARASGQIGDYPPGVVLRTIIGQVAAYLALGGQFGEPRDDAAEVERIVALILDGLRGRA